jgi:hypothetical protein
MRETARAGSALRQQQGVYLMKTFGVGPARAGAAIAIMATTAAMSVPTGAHAGATINFGEDQSLSIGAGFRADFTSAERGAPDGTSRSADFSLDDMRLYINGSINKYIKGTFNTERDAHGNVEVLDGIGRFEFAPEFNIWIGRMLPPSDRSNLDGPFYLSSWLYPFIEQYPAKFAGRDDGATLWGKVFDKHLVYAFGVFNGHNRIAGASNQSDNVLFAGRVAYNFWDVEDDPAYYTSSTYYGSADILTAAFAGMYQKDGVGTAAVKGDYGSWNFDLLLEKKVLDGGAATFEAAYYNYSTGGVADVAPTFAGADSTANVGGLVQGDAFLVSAAFLFPSKVAWGKFQPVVRYEQFNADLTKTTQREYDIGVNYIIDGHNARLSLVYAKDEASGTSGSDKVVLGVQLQY